MAQRAALWEPPPSVYTADAVTYGNIDFLPVVRAHDLLEVRFLRKSLEPLGNFYSQKMTLALLLQPVCTAPKFFWYDARIPELKFWSRNAR